MFMHPVSENTTKQTTSKVLTWPVPHHHYHHHVKQSHPQDISGSPWSIHIVPANKVWFASFTLICSLCFLMPTGWPFYVWLCSVPYHMWYWCFVKASCWCPLLLYGVPILQVSIITVAVTVAMNVTYTDGFGVHQFIKFQSHSTCFLFEYHVMVIIVYPLCS